MSLDAAIDRVTDRVKPIPGVMAVLLTGSAARGELLPNSEYDFLVLIDDGVPWPMPFRDGGREAYIDDDATIPIRWLGVSYTMTEVSLSIPTPPTRRANSAGDPMSPFSARGMLLPKPSM